MRSPISIEKKELSDKYEAYLKQLLDFLIEFKSMWDGCLLQVNIAKHRIEIANKRTKPVHSESYQERPKAQQLERSEIHKFLSQKIIESAQT